MRVASWIRVVLPQPAKLHWRPAVYERNGATTTTTRDRNILVHAITYVETADQARRVEESLERTTSVAVDCEAAGFHRYSDRLCLVQLSTPQRTFVLDPLALDVTPHLKPFLEDRRRLTVMHGADYDLRLLRRDLGIHVAALSDTQVAASLLGEPAIGLQALLERHLGILVSKKYQRADWAARPLPRDMIDYAAGDTRHLHRLIHVLETGLRELGRLAWAHEEYDRLLEHVAATGGSDSEVDPVTRFKVARKMDDRSVTRLRAAIAWRDGVARAKDRAPFRVAPDAALLAAVLARPRSVGALATVKGFRPQLARREGRGLIEALRRVEALPERELAPYPKPAARGVRPGPDEEAALDRLKVARNRAAHRLRLDRGRTMANQALRDIVAAMPADRTELAALREVRRWQVETFGGELLRALWQR